MIRNYNEQQLEDNYNRFIDAIKKVFKGDRLDKLLHMYSSNELVKNHITYHKHQSGIRRIRKRYLLIIQSYNTLM